MTRRIRHRPGPRPSALNATRPDTPRGAPRDAPSRASERARETHELSTSRHARPARDASPHQRSSSPRPAPRHHPALSGDRRRTLPPHAAASASRASFCSVMSRTRWRLRSSRVRSMRDRLGGVASEAGNGRGWGKGAAGECGETADGPVPRGRVDVGAEGRRGRRGERGVSYPFFSPEASLDGSPSRVDTGGRRDARLVLDVMVGRPGPDAKREADEVAEPEAAGI